MANSEQADQLPGYVVIFYILPFRHSLRKHSYSNILKILQPKKENFLIKILIFFILLLKT